MTFIKIKLSIIIGMTCLLVNANSQDFSLLDITFIDKDGKTLASPLTGGINTGQFSSIDLNEDGKKDLFVFDRGGNKVLTFINEGAPGEIKYRYAPEYRDLFPPMQSWAILRDFNDDGIEDIFTGFIGSIQVYRGSRDNGELSFELMGFKDAPAGLDVIPILVGNQYTNLYAAITDIPAIEDLDGDGDLDILSFEVGGSYVSYFRNMQSDLGLDEDTLVYRLEDLCWGKFFEDGFSEAVTLPSDCNNCATFGSQNNNDDDKHARHAGSTVTAFDGDGDGDMDLLVGDLANEHMVYISNGGTPENACADNQDTTFPSYDTPIEMFVFNAAFYLDINNDGKRDLIATPNQDGTARNQDHIWLYINKGTDDSPIFELAQKDFLVNEMVMLGSGSAPEFIDYNQDGLLDLLIGSSGVILEASAKIGNVELWLNTGSKNVPEFTQVDDDFLNMKDLSNNGTNFSPASGDLDNDGDTDILVGDLNGQLYYFENNAGPGAIPVYENFVYPYGDIFIGQNAAPCIYDVEGDGLNDIVIGEARSNNVNGVKGSLNYFKNFGVEGTPSFPIDPTTKILYQFRTGDDNQLFNSSDPVYVPHPDDGAYLFIGSDQGHIYVLTDVIDNPQGPVDTISTQLGGWQLGRRATVAVGDIDNDEFLEVIIGNRSGGLEAYNTDLRAKKLVSVEEPQDNAIVRMYPNPSSHWIHVESDEDIEFLHLNGIDGQRYDITLKDSHTLDISGLPNGIYIVEMNLDGHRLIQKLIKVD